MTVVIQNKRKATEYLVPAGGAILWYGVASAVPSGWAIDSYCANVFVRGAAAGAATNTPASDNSHTHTNPSASGSQASHTHPIGGGNTGSSSGTNEVYPTSNISSAPAHTHSISSGTSGSGGGHSHTLSAAALAAAFPPYAQMYWIKATLDSALPVGGILMWDNVIASRPGGFSLCNGSGGTPDLRDKFVYGAASDGELGATGGADTHSHTNANSGDAGTHAHSLSVGTGSAPSNTNVSGYDGGTTVAAGGHTHTVSGTANAEADHSHTLSNTGTGTSLPVYLKLYFIQRVS